MRDKGLIGNVIEIFLFIMLGVLLVILWRFFERIGIVPASFDIYILFMIAIFITYLVTRFLGNIIYRFSRLKFNESNAKNFKLTFEILFFTVVGTIILFTIGTNITTALVSAGFIGIVLGIAAQTVLSNFFAGFYIIFSKPFNIGERVTIVTWQYGGFPSSYPHEFQIPDYTGVVEEIGFLFTKIINDQNVLITIPSGILIQAMIFNYSRSNKRVERVRVDIPLDIDINEFKEKFMESFKDDNIKILEIKILNLFTDHLNILITAEYSPQLKTDTVVDEILKHAYTLIKKLTMVNKKSTS